MLRETPRAKPSMDLRERLLAQINAVIDQRGWSPKECEKELGMRQARVSELLNGKAEAFSVDKLADIASALGYIVVTALSTAAGEL
jgi:predicted XRE-type DNA-binding protein